MIELSELRSLSFFGDLTNDELKVLSGFAEKKSYADNAAVFLEGMPGEALYIITSGKVKVSRMLAEGDERTIAVLGAGDTFGELALLDSGSRLITARVSEMAELISIKGKDITGMMSTNPVIYAKIVHRIASLFANRLRENGEKIKEIIRG